jgi:outer membrane protein TolC
MRTTTVKLAPLAALLALLGGLAIADEPNKPADPKKGAEEKKPSQLEELIAQALRDNPDIRVAEAKTREAEAELSRVRLQVIQKVVAHQHTVETLDGAVKTAEANYKLAQAKLTFAEAEYKRLAAAGAAVTQQLLDEKKAYAEQARADVSNAQAALQSAKADLAKAQSELPYLLGKGHKDDKPADATRREAERALYALSIAQAEAAWKTAELPRGSVADKLRKALDTTTTLKVDAGSPLDDVLDYLKARAGVPVVNNLPHQITLQKEVNLDGVPLGAAFQCIEDVAGVRFGVRDYGILVSDKLPSDVTRLHDFWKADEKPK